MGGERFSAPEEHELFMSIPEDDPDLQRAGIGRGYRAGHARIPPTEKAVSRGKWN